MLAIIFRIVGGWRPGSPSPKSSIGKMRWPESTRSLWEVQPSTRVVRLAYSEPVYAVQTPAIIEVGAGIPGSSRLQGIF